MDELDTVLDSVGPRLRALRLEAELTLADLATTTGISVSTLSRLESGGRRPTLELLLPLARAHGLALDDLVGADGAADPRVPQRAVTRGGMTMVPLSRRAGGLQAYKLTIPPGRRRRQPDPQTHEGYEWLYVLDGRLRMVLGDHDVVLEPGEVAEFDTRLPHWFGGADERRVEFLSIFGREGERMHTRARSTDRRQDD
ncbi:helix-turn-helix domain-containing protein [Nocardioides aurantiacus]|uniref:XRE family transcriptional regulator n=1 Tax=Nocardioides aurantiacus TaxID=86796 RepID=A0A3N2CU39_9ACTN|nr:XRE family transcriptional regulator [Nocardioides aurantiacus]ROR90724.1 XRE family transcriptional regulator [Nocardioides aurantiacus]